nr:outer membrane beta-barrel protein [uncultured Porphyromonas sp.]
MKKLFFAAVALVATSFAAQAQINPRIEVAANIARTIAKDASGADVNGLKVLPGFRAGLAAEIGIASGVYIAPGISFRQEGNKQEVTTGQKTETVSNTLNYISVPVNLGVRVPLTESLAISVEGGPAFSYGVSSSVRTLAGIKGGIKSAYDAFKEKQYNRFDMSINASAALEFSKIYVRLGTDLGMVNSFKEATDKLSSKNTSFFLGLGYRF